ncbi:MAG TPA: outer membrane protein assembly factor BamA [Rhodanobacteraceae bacterium]|nr:outer membrane protein assembly factor BamA [Rhodanobacteraceae bacterium]
MKRIAALILFACLTAPAYAAFDPFVVTDIRIDGLERISAGTLLTYLPVQKGDTLTESDAQKAIRALFRTGFFSDIKLDRQGGILVVHVTERPAISKLTLRGNKDIKSEDLLKGLKSMGIAEGETFDRLSLDRMTQELITQYYNRGKYNVSVEPHVIKLDRNRVTLDIDIKEGKAAKIKDINLVGNYAYPDALIRKSFESGTTNMGSWYSKNDQYSREKLSGDLEKLSNFYLNRGYANFAIDSTQVTISPDKRAMYIDADVNEGEIYHISEVKLLGNLVLPEKTIDNVVYVKKGQRFSRALIEVTKNTIQGLLANIGYAFAEVTPIPKLDNEKHEVAVSFYVKPGARVYVRRINFNGNTRTEDEVIRREMRQLEGAWYAQSAIDRSKARLLRLGYFKSVDIDTKPVPGSNDQVDLNIKVEEQSAGSLMVGVGYSQLDGIIGTFSVSQNNFLGTGRAFNANVQRSSYMEQYNVGYVDPYFTDSGVSLAYNLQWSKLDRGDANLANYLYSVRSFSTLLGVPISETDSVSVGLGIGSQRINTFVGGTPDVLIDYINELNHKTIHSWTANLGWGHDTRDRYFLPTRGGAQYVSAEIALPGSTVQYGKLYYNINHYWRLPAGFVLYTSGTVGYGDTYGRDKDRGYPFWENYFAGGVGDVRGFQDNTLGPRVCIGADADGNPIIPDANDKCSGSYYAQPIGGSFKVLGKAELYFPIRALEESGTARIGAFVDFGNVFKDAHSFDSKDLRASAGIALQWRAPVGPISISFAQPLRYKDSDRHYFERIQFTFGTQF